jgi:glutathionyl-hydroquinone reductase
VSLSLAIRNVPKDYTSTDGVYKSGFATSAEAYEAAVYPLFESLDKLEKILEGKEYLIGGQLTEADVRLFPTIVRWLSPCYKTVSNCDCRIDPF